MQLVHSPAKLLSIAVIALAAGCTGNASGTHPVDLKVRVGVRPEGRNGVVAVLDRIAAERGWTKTPAVGLSELAKRQVVYFSYGRNPKDMLITISNLSKETEFEVNAYFEEKLPGVVEAAASRFASEVGSVKGVLAVTQEHPGSQ